MNRAVIVATVIAAGAALSSAAHAAVVLDQSNLPGQFGYNPLGPTFVPGQITAEMAQTFTVGQTGTLSSIEVLLLSFDSVITLSVFPVVAGVPDTTGAPLASLTQFLPSSQQFFSFDLSGAGLNVIAGQQLAYALSGDFSRWIGAFNDSYAGGIGFYRFPGATDGSPTDWAQLAPTDAYFQTYVDVIPAPGAASLLGLAGLAAARRRR